jgi:hypothetical protein
LDIPALYRTELVARIQAATNDLAWAARDLDDLASHYRPEDDEWSIHEHLSHVRDMDQEVVLPLLRWIAIPGMLDPRDYSRHDWRRNRYNPNEPVSRIITDIFRMHEEEAEIVQTMTDSAWEELRDDSRWGPMTGQWIAELIYRHTLDHLQQVMALRQDIHLLGRHAASPSERELIAAAR